MEISILKNGMTHMMVSVEKTWLIIIIYQRLQSKNRNQDDAAWVSRLHQLFYNEEDVKWVSGKA